MLINKLKKERGFLVVVRVIPSLLRRIKNFYYSFVFGCNNLRVGCNCLLVGTKSIFIGDGVLVGNFNWLEALNGGCIYIGNNVSLSSNVHIAAAKEVSIGDGCLIGSDVLITDHNHVFGEEYNNTPPKLRGLEIKGNTYGRWFSCFTQAQGYIYSGTIINYSVTHLGYAAIDGLTAFNYNGKLCFWFHNQSYWEGAELQQQINFIRNLRDGMNYSENWIKEYAYRMFTN